MSKKELAEKLGFDFDEVKDILSEETLKSFEQNSIIGGDEPVDGEICQIPIDGETCMVDPFGPACTIEPDWASCGN